MTKWVLDSDQLLSIFTNKIIKIILKKINNDDDYYYHCYFHKLNKIYLVVVIDRVRKKLKQTN